MGSLWRVLVVSLAVAVVGSPGSAQSMRGRIDGWETTPYRPYDIAILADGTPWLTVLTDGLMRLDPVAGTVATYYPSPAPSPAPQMDRLTVAPDGTLWVADMNDRLWHFDPSTLTYTRYDVPGATFGPWPQALVVGPDGAVWFTCMYDSGIGRLDPSGPSWQHFVPPDGEAHRPSGLVFDPAGSLWFTLRQDGGGAPGLGKLDPDTGVFELWDSSPYPGAFSPYGITFLRGEVWFADHSANKIVGFDPATETFTPYDTPLDLRDAHFLVADRDGILYTGGYVSSTVAAFDPRTGGFAVRSLDRPDEAKVMRLARDPEGRIWWAENGTPSYRGVGRLTPAGPAALAVGVIERTVGPDAMAGAVTVLYGRFDHGVTGDNEQVWTQDALGVDPSEVWDRFGYSQAAGDFNGDGRVDLAVGVPWEDIGGHANGGVVHVLYTVAERGLTLAGSQLWHQDQVGVLDEVEDGDAFGYALAAGDFDGDGYDDLAIGAPGEDVGTDPQITDAGCVNVLYGSGAGLTGTADQFFSQDTSGVLEDAEGGDRFGAALAVGDFDGDGYDDLAIGAPDEDLGTETSAGCVHVLYGASYRLSGIDDDLWHQALSGIQDEAEDDDRFGFSLAAGDFSGDGYDELVIGVPNEEVAGVYQAGAIHVLPGSSSGLGDVGDQLFSQDNTSVADVPEAGDSYGHSLAVGDFDADGYDDLAVGVPFENPGSVSWAGAVNVLYGTGGGLNANGDQLWSQNSPGVSDSCEAQDRFGLAVAVGDFDADGRDDLAIGAPFEDINGHADAGAVNVLFGTAIGLSGSGSQLWHEDLSQLQGQAADGSLFGASLVALYSPRSELFSDGFESGDTGAWSGAAR